ncbi:MAG TPA: hydroxyisourate hydrolase [Xanthomonadaceae bacterium]|nr:hydroxyisourate hydrolase [Xanthomonadaceae bacterium]
MGKLTTHVLDTATGRPAAGVAIKLYRLEGGERIAQGASHTNSDGRCNAPLLEGEAMQSGQYELDFAVGDYFFAQGTTQPVPRFLDVVTLRFGIADPAMDYHVPLLVSPWSYSTYRGS